jgi:hypothetical protein
VLYDACGCDLPQHPRHRSGFQDLVRLLEQEDSAPVRAFVYKGGTASLGKGESHDKISYDGRDNHGNCRYGRSLGGLREFRVGG